MVFGYRDQVPVEAVDQRRQVELYFAVAVLMPEFPVCLPECCYCGPGLVPGRHLLDDVGGFVYDGVGVFGVLVRPDVNCRRHDDDPLRGLWYAILRPCRRAVPIPVLRFSVACLQPEVCPSVLGRAHRVAADDL